MMRKLFLDVSPARRRAGLAAALALLSAGGALAQEFRLFPDPLPPSYYFDLETRGTQSSGFRLTSLLRYWPWSRSAPDRLADADFDAPAGLLDGPLSELPPLPPRTRPRISSTPTALTTGVVLAGAAVYGASAGWEHGFTSAHFANEGFFGEDTYGGGSDKVSHFIVSASLGRELALFYDRLGHPRSRSTTLALGITALSGLIVEVGDAFSPYGFSWEDLTADFLGTATGVFLTREGLNDLIGLRIGIVPTGLPEDDCCAENLGTGYSKEIYSADLKLAGLAQRMRFDPGPARFLMMSVTYGTKGYGYEPPRPDRQRNVGVELGLNLPEILSAVGVPEETWWGNALYKTFNFFRVPFTSFGFHYDLNSGQWHGPDTGNKMD